MSLRAQTLQNIYQNKKDVRFSSNSKDKQITEYFGKLVFGPDAIKKYLMRDAYENLMNAIETGERIDAKTADFVAVGMKNWAMDNGATHYTHWFQPLTGKTAEKHDSFFRLDKNGNAIETFSGSALVKQEPDGSSFPSGGLRATHSARAYTIWDPSSYAFIIDSSYGKTLCIPTIFISYNGESLDLKTPLLKSIHAIEKAATDVCRYFDTRVNKVTPTLGWEQEYFIVDEALYNQRMDLMSCGRTLFGNASARGQQLEDHYFASIPERVHDFMLDFEDDCLMLGIPITTRHNEVAPNQYECAPYFEFVNIAADHNQLLMDIIDKIAKRHRLRALLHEKPFAGVNGSGKHNNWSLQTDLGKNLLDPGDDPSQNLQFMTFFINVIKAVYNHGNLLRASIATAGNEHRLGANEAPPAIISVYTGDYLEHVLNAFKNDQEFRLSDEDSELMINVPKIAKVDRDTTDRNRTSPFPFTGNRFEFRAVGSSVNVSHPMTVLNTMVADQLGIFKLDVDEMINNGYEKEKAIREVLKRYLTEAEVIIYNGNGYSDEWVVEAEKRGLKNIKSTPEALDMYLTEESRDLFVNNNIFTDSEIKARYSVFLEEYIKKIEIEARLCEEISRTQIIPAVIKYQTSLLKNLKSLESLSTIEPNEGLRNLLSQINSNLNSLLLATDTLTKEREMAHHHSTEALIAKAYHNNVKSSMDKVRLYADKLELIVEDNSWPLPKYRELLYIH